MVEFPELHGVPQCTIEHYEDDFADRHLLHGVVAKWAKEKPDELAIVNADTGDTVTWDRFERSSTALALKLVDMGFSKGDHFATTLPLLTEHVFLEYACFKIGVILVPLDLRLKGPEVIRSLNLVRPKGYAFLGQTELADFRELGKAAMGACPFIEHFVQVSPQDQDVIEGAMSVHQLGSDAMTLAMEAFSDAENHAGLARYQELTASVDEDDGALAIFTTGSTGYPKPALLSHRNITCQNMCLGAAFGMDAPGDIMLVNLPPSHVGCQTEQLMTPFFYGGSVVILHIFDPVKTLQAIQDHEVTSFGQIPALFAMEWRLPNYGEFDLSSLKFALYGGQQVSRQFLDQLSTMAPGFGTGLGLTETAGFCTYTPLDGTVDDILAGVGYDMPVYPMTIRELMADDGSAGAVKADGETGHICFSGPQTFLGYINAPEATAKTVSTDGVLYTGDMGYVDDQGLHFAGRAKHVIKPKGYQVFPAQVEDHLGELREKVGGAAVVGVPHEVYSEGIVAYVETKPDVELSVDELREHARGMAGYMRPAHYVVLGPGEIPLNRVAKTDYVVLKQRAEQEVADLRQSGGWDQA
jgi:fatty-acyl-CoA synthase